MMCGGNDRDRPGQYKAQTSKDSVPSTVLGPGSFSKMLSSEEYEIMKGSEEDVQQYKETCSSGQAQIEDTGSGKPITGRDLR